MKAKVGDHVIIHGHRVGEPEREGLVTAVVGENGEPPYRVIWGDDGHESLFFPGPDAEIRKPVKG